MPWRATARLNAIKMHIRSATASSQPPAFQITSVEGRARTGTLTSPSGAHLATPALVLNTRYGHSPKSDNSSIESWSASFGQLAVAISSLQMYAQLLCLHVSFFSDCLMPLALIGCGRPSVPGAAGMHGLARRLDHMQTLWQDGYEHNRGHWWCTQVLQPGRRNHHCQNKV